MFNLTPPYSFFPRSRLTADSRNDSSEIPSVMYRSGDVLEDDFSASSIIALCSSMVMEPELPISMEP
ncbi:hypothetical protein D3C75_1360910 [compost metagenome]